MNSNDFCWTLRNVDETIAFGAELRKKFPRLKLLFLEGPLGAGKTSLVKGIAKELGIKEPITSPTFPLAQYYRDSHPPLVHLDLYRLNEASSANELFLQEEEEARAYDALMIVEWPERLSISVADAWRAKLNYRKKEGRTIQIFPPL